MNKDEFNNLTIENQVEYINKCLNTNNSSLTKISKNLGIDRATIRKRFEKNNYIFDKNNHIYIINNTHNIKNMPLTRPTIQKNDGSINLAYLKALESQVSDLKIKYDKLIDTILPKNNTNNTNNINLNNKFKFYEGEVVNRAYKINKDVQQRFKTFCKKNSEYRVSDILSTILEEYLDTNE